MDLKTLRILKLSPAVLSGTVVIIQGPLNNSDSCQCSRNTSLHPIYNSWCGFGSRATLALFAVYKAAADAALAQ